MTEKIIAIVEDDQLLSLVLTKHLTLEGYRTLSFSKGEDLIGSISKGFTPNVAILDVKLKGDMDGIELFNNLPIDLPVIFCTGNSDHPFFKNNNDPKIKGVLIKPIDLKELSTLLQNNL